MVIINNVNDTQFTLNGILYYKIFVSFVSGQTLNISSAYDYDLRLIEFTLFNEVQVDGNNFTSIAALQAALLPVIFTRGDIGEGGTGNGASLAPFVSVSGALLKKDAANSNSLALENGDLVLWKEITNNGEPITLFGYTYNGGDEQLETSYSLNNEIQ